MHRDVSESNVGSLLPVILGDVLTIRLPASRRVHLLADGDLVGQFDADATLGDAIKTRAVVVPQLAAGTVLRALELGTGLDLAGSPLRLREPHRTGRIDRVAGRFVFGSVDDPTGKGDEVSVVAFVNLRAIAFAVARPAAGAAGALTFTLFLPVEVVEGPPVLVHLGIVGTRSMLSGSPVRAGLEGARIVPQVHRRAARPLRLAIKISTPNLRVAQEWGDYHFARALKKSLERLGWVVDVDTQDAWYRNRDADVVLALRGRHRFTVDSNQINLLWIISHPDRLDESELDDYDHVFVASDVYLKTLKTRFRGSVSAMHQATDADLFKPPETREVRSPVLFVGNSRREYRTMVRWCIERKLPIALWGGLWDGIVPPEIVKGTLISNEDLPNFYGTSGVLLNDHWDTMRDNGFLSNRLFDGSAAGAFIITDPVRGLAEIFGDAIEVAENAEDLAAKVEYALAHQEASWERAERARQIVLANHTFDHRARTIIAQVEALGRRTRAVGD